MKAKKILITIVAVMSILAMSFTSMATAYYKEIYLYANQAWTNMKDNPGTRTGNNSYASVKCHNVYPEGGIDTYSKMRVHLVDTYGTDLSDIYILKEGDDYEKVYLLEGKMTTTNFYYEFSGNSSADAYARVSYVDN